MTAPLKIGGFVSIPRWWALEVETGPYGLDRPQRALIVTTDPTTLPDLATWYLVTKLPTPETARVHDSPHALAGHPPAGVGGLVRLYGLHIWIEHTLGWSDYQVVSDRAIRRHWEVVCCAFAFCWWVYRRLPDEAEPEPATAGRGTKRTVVSWPQALRAVRVWLEPWVLLWRYWHAYSRRPPPLALQTPLEQFFAGQGLDLYVH